MARYLVAALVFLSLGIADIPLQQAGQASAPVDIHQGYTPLRLSQ